jgi:hypothetical protein
MYLPYLGEMANYCHKHVKRSKEKTYFLFSWPAMCAVRQAIIGTEKQDFFGFGVLFVLMAIAMV